MLEVVGLSKRFGEIVAVDDVSFRVGEGETVGLLGPNGAGKTTVISIVCGLIKADAGEARFDGEPISGDLDPRKAGVGLAPQDVALYEELSAIQNLRFFGTLYDLRDEKLDAAIAEALELVGLTERARDRVSTYSGGMKRRLNIAAALLHDPGLLILDEPTVGVDPQSRNAIFENLEHLKSRGKSLIYTTHYMEEAERLCDRIVIMDRGRVVADDDLAGLNKRVFATSRLYIDVEENLDADAAWIEEIRAVPGVANARIESKRLAVDLASLSNSSEVVARVSAAGMTVSRLAGERPSLETVFLALTGRSLRDS